MADRLVRIVDRYMPKVADENRAYVMPYPGNVKTMLQKAWGLRKRIRRRANKSQRQTTGRRGQASASGGADNAAQQRAEEVEESRDMEGERPAMREKRERSVSEARHRDWGDGDSPLGCPASTDDDDGDDAQFSQWPWGPGLIGQRWRRCTASRKAQRARGGATTQKNKGEHCRGEAPRT